MRHTTAGAALLVLTIGMALPAPGQRFRADPVEKLRRVLTEDFKTLQTTYRRVGMRDAGNVYRGKLKAAVGGLGDSLSEISSALLLLEWNRITLAATTDAKDRELSFDDQVSALERPVRAELLKRFVDLVKKRLETDDPAKQVALCNLIGEALSGSSDPTAGEKLVAELKELALALAKLAESDAKADVREAAARALARFYTEVPTAVAAWKTLMKPEQPEGLRRAAAESVESMLVATSGVERLPVSEPGITTRDQPLRKTPVKGAPLAKMTAALVPLAGAGAADEAAAVRLPSVRALREATLALDRLAKAEITPTSDLIGKKVDELEREFILGTLDITAQIDKAARAFAAQSATLRARLFDSDARVRSEARMTLSALGKLRTTLAELEAALAALKKDQPESFPKGKDKDAIGADGLRLVREAGPPDREPFLQGAEVLDGLLRDLGRKLADDGFAQDDAPSRRAAGEAIEAMGELALPLVPQLTKATKDRDIFVRWIAARTLGNLGRGLQNEQAAQREKREKLDDIDRAGREAIVERLAELEKMSKQLAEAVPGLVCMFDDEDQDARIAAYTAIGRIGPDAKDAVPAIAERLTKGDVEVRVAAIRALEGIGEASASALPTLVGLFTFSDARLRREAVGLVGRFEGKARPYLADLRKLIDDRDAQVRQRASAAILAIED